MSVGLKANVDGSGAIQVGGTDAINLSTGLNATFVQNANLPNTFGFKNRIINGAMVIDQRNAGAAVTHSGAANLYVLDRWVCNSTGTPQFSVQRVADAPAGFINSSKLTTTTAGTPASGDFSYYGQYIEGYNIADLAWGTASAATVTLSFWVKSSLTGTFGGTLKNGAVNRAYPFSYTISAANTWELKSVTIAGDTTGTWTTDNTVGIVVFFDTGSGVNNKGTAGAWNATSNIGVTGGVNLVATASATWQVTGVQLEKGSTATSFDYRDYGRELAMCQRYYISGKAPRARNPASSTQTIMGQVCYPVVMRASPTVTNSAGAGPDTGAGEYGFSTQESVAATSTGSNITYTASAEL